MVQYILAKLLSFEWRRIMKSKKRMLIVLCIVFALNLMVIGTIFQLFYSTAASTAEVQGNSNDVNASIITAKVATDDENINANPSTSLHYIYISNKWSRIKNNGQADYLAAQYIALNTAGSIITKYETSQLGTTTVDTQLQTGPGGSYSNVVLLPIGKKLELTGEITNPAGEKWLMYNYAYAVYFVAAKDVQITVQIPTPVAASATQKPTQTKPVTPTNPVTPTPTIPPATENAQKILSLAYSKLGCAYVSGAVGPNTFDCSGFVYWVVNNSGIPGLSVPRSSQTLYEQFKSYSVGTSIVNAKPGDIILFSTNGTVSGISHSAIYFKYDTLIHASTPSTGVILTSVAYSTTNKSIFAIIRLPGC
jgi:cell wall-associated NlpC family hydrolase